MQTAWAEFRVSSQIRPDLTLLFLCLLAKELKLSVILGSFVVGCLVGLGSGFFLPFENTCHTDKMLLHGYL